MAGPQAWLDGPEGTTDGRTDKQTNKRTDGRKITPFYRTLSPIGAVALLPPIKIKEKAWLALDQAWLVGPQAWLDGPEGGMDGQTKECMENLPILQDFVPYRGCCPKSQEIILRD